MLTLFREMGSRVHLPLLLLALFFIVHVAADSGPSSVQFKNWYPGFRHYLNYQLDHACADARADYYNTSIQHTNCSYCRPQQLANCILNNLDEVTKANAASAAVILGLLPSTLSLVGLSYLDTGLLAHKRPLLAFLLASGSPAVSPIRTYDYRDPADILQIYQGAIKSPTLGTGAAIAVSAVEYALAIATVTNLVVATYMLSVRTICSFAAEVAYMPVIWPFLALLIHFVGTIALSLRVRFSEPGNQRLSLASIVRREFLPCSLHPVTELQPKKESALFIIIAWCLSTGTVLHLILGTLVLSSLLFISTQDAVMVAAQYLGSTLVCRMILMFELAGLRETVQVKELKEKDDDSAGLLQQKGVYVPLRDLGGHEQLS